MADDGDRVICHACGGVWLLDSRDDSSSLECPHCESDFTEIVEIPPDSPQSEREPELHSPPINPWADHNPWTREEPSASQPSGWMDSGSPGYSHRSYRSPDGRFMFSSTTIGGGYSPRQGNAQPNAMLPLMMQSLDSLFQGLSESYDHQGQRSPAMDHPRHPYAAGMRDHDPVQDPMHSRSITDEDAEQREGLFPRDPDGPQHMTVRVESLAELVTQLSSRMSVLPFDRPMAMVINVRPRRNRLLQVLRGNIGTQRTIGRHGVRAPVSPNPFAMLSALLNVDRNGDAVYSQEELDRVISQLIDHNQQGTAAPPASDNAIRSLPRKKVTQQMIGSDGKAECSICMDAVELDTEVTVLPCTHWFHYNCIEAWLSQHNTCPHCRRSIDSAGTTSPDEGTSENPGVTQDGSEFPSSASRRRRSSPLASRSTRSGRSSVSRSSRNSPTPEIGDSGTRRGSRGESQRGGLTGWVWSRFGGGSG
ncbi:uncharacterized protein N7482_004080 [Penicillium canariense]|uniref:RING-type E3 ubiquitin transferase n=1 Tax=Penicillium canariense TaxID=189055 RepID=A0A9W9I5W8_9EURO|nr:uncharacterized protein N7482_004080 [Penicillium canariense]KAJ5168486.1 hypothetical protein N7482_004080 [Penicillium canariense]